MTQQPAAPKSKKPRSPLQTAAAKKLLALGTITRIQGQLHLLQPFASPELLQRFHGLFATVEKQIRNTPQESLLDCPDQGKAPK